MNVKLTCDYCGKEFVCYHKERMSHINHFCSKKCEGEYRKAHNPNWQPCAICGKLIYVKPHKKNGKHPHCCSRKCLGILRSKLYIGCNNPNYGNTGSNNPLWKSDNRTSYYGYILVRKPDHPFANCDGFVFLHRLIAEQYLLTDENSVVVDGVRYLSPCFEVHHIDFDKTNNNPANLQILSKSDHMKLHQALRKLPSLNPEKSMKPKA